MQRTAWASQQPNCSRQSHQVPAAITLPTAEPQPAAEPQRPRRRKHQPVTSVPAPSFRPWSGAQTSGVLVLWQLVLVLHSAGGYVPSRLHSCAQAAGGGASLSFGAGGAHAADVWQGVPAGAPVVYASQAGLQHLHTSFRAHLALPGAGPEVLLAKGASVAIYANASHRGPEVEPTVRCASPSAAGGRGADAGGMLRRPVLQQRREPAQRPRLPNARGAAAPRARRRCPVLQVWQHCKPAGMTC